ncbi:Outer membrane beta-barrel protein [Sulfidibacter corallicola]|uniref:Outer membrane beta-barrel protein n=1 Tax=Sulfidibacter corallicola TaxID=2818388 RepID=A0A8A4TRY8_SULCO|nr:outer membrane beta-barrel protein [Sulfidibacter corallicola]QTD52726.1 outer membrane beta-barrel protein [Sulfidibacter corallicola]
MKRLAVTLLLGLFCASSLAPALAGGLDFGVMAGAYSPTDGLDDNDNGVAFGANIQFKFAVIGVKLEGFIIDSSGRYADALGAEFGEAQIDVENILSADLMYFPLGTTFYLQAGLNRINLEKDNIDLEIVDNETGFEVGAGAIFFDKLTVQGKVLYTPDAIEETALDTLDNLNDKDLMSFLVAVGWQF